MSCTRVGTTIYMNIWVVEIAEFICLIELVTNKNHKLFGYKFIMYW